MDLRVEKLGDGTFHGAAGKTYGWASKNRGKTPKWMVKIMENPIFEWIIWGENPLFWKHPTIANPGPLRAPLADVAEFQILHD